jgi:hypothetical protein
MLEHEAFSGYAKAKNATKSNHTTCRSGSGYRSPPVQVQGRSTVDHRFLPTPHGGLELGLVAYAAPAEDCLDR